MNNLGLKVLNILQDSPMGKMSEYLLEKQARDAGIDLDNLKKPDLDVIRERLEKILPFFIGSQTQAVMEKLQALE